MAKFKVQKGCRVKKGTWRRDEPGVTKRSPMFIGLEPENRYSLNKNYPRLLWCSTINKWVTHEEFRELQYNFDNGITTYGFGDSMNGSIKSLKAAEAHLRRHDEIPKGMKFILVSFFPEYDIELVKK